jgi:hypothetical protein
MVPVGLYPTAVKRTDSVSHGMEGKGEDVKRASCLSIFPLHNLSSFLCKKLDK